jgi:hypothetical protein
MRREISIVYFVLWLAVPMSLCAQSFRTQPLSERVKTLLVHSSVAWDAPPIIEGNSENQIEINFDILSVSSEYLTYTLTHCNADWTPSPLATSEYLSGFQNNYIEDYLNSFNTKMDYVNYKLLIPNDKVQLKVSGNYVVQVLDNDGNPILSACFSVLESRADIGMQVSSVTDKGINSHYQAVSFEITYGNEVKSPMQDLKVYVQQNRRFDNEAVLVKPLSVQNRKVVYDHNPALIFEAGNEYRAFEMTNVRYNGLGVETVEYHAPYYHTILKPDAPRSNYHYSYNEDIDGRIYIRNSDAEDSDTEADYQLVHFYLPCDKPFNENVYILSEAFHNLLDSRSQMDYSAQDKGYIKAVLLKEGYYNYLYVTRKNTASPASAAFIEGNYHETENEYRIMVYFRPIGGRYDRLIGVKTLQYK